MQLYELDVSLVLSSTKKLCACFCWFLIYLTWEFISLPPNDKDVILNVKVVHREPQASNSP